jgi:GT2 family glycosyltransferase
MTEQPRPVVTVVISTCNRGARILTALRSVLLNDYQGFEVIIVDQSGDGVTQESIRPFLGDSRVRYERSKTRGISSGQNLGCRLSRGRIIATTDDDCEVPPNWIASLASAFDLNGRIGIIFGNVLAGPHDRDAGFIPAYVRREPCLARGIEEKHRVEGISACMGVRCDAWKSLGGLDEMLGIGARFPAAGETDLAIRGLLAGFFVYESPDVYVIHHGFRTRAEGRVLIGGYMRGIGAMLAKHVKCGHWPVLRVMYRLAARWAFSRPVVDLGRRPPRIHRLACFMHGFFSGLSIPVDRISGHFVGIEVGRGTDRRLR